MFSVPIGINCEYGIFSLCKTYYSCQWLLGVLWTNCISCAVFFFFFLYYIISFPYIFLILIFCIYVLQISKYSLHYTASFWSILKLGILTFIILFSFYFSFSMLYLTCLLCFLILFSLIHLFHLFVFLHFFMIFVFFTSICVTSALWSKPGTRKRAPLSPLPNDENI